MDDVRRREEAERLKAKGDYLKSHVIQALALESAEAYAEWIHGLIRNEHADRLYLVLEGEGRFTVAGESFAVQAGEVVIVPRQTPYDYEGRMKLFLVHAPANHDAWDISLEEPPRPATPPAAPDQAV